MQSSNEDTIEKIAELLANRAVFTEITSAPRTKSAGIGSYLKEQATANPGLTAGLGGAAIGALAGAGSSYMNEDPRDRQPLQNALIGGLAGGAIGFGGSMAAKNGFGMGGEENAPAVPRPEMEQYSLSPGDAKGTLTAGAGIGAAHGYANLQQAADSYRDGAHPYYKELFEKKPEGLNAAVQQAKGGMKNPMDYLKKRFSKDPAVRNQTADIMRRGLDSTNANKSFFRRKGGLGLTAAALLGSGLLEQRYNVAHRNAEKQRAYLKELGQLVR